MMKTLVAVSLIAVVTGCATAPSPEFERISKKYATVGRSMNRDHVYQLLGPPNGTDDQGRLHWWMEEAGHREDLWLRFGEDGQMILHERNSSEE